MQSKEVFVPVWGSVRLTPRELRVIDHPAFQRLREINQLGFVSTVFPGATHKRFEHAIGTLHAVTVMMDAVERNRVVLGAQNVRSNALEWLPDAPLSPSERELTRLGALLHDIGHLAYGHTFEDELALLAPHDADERLNLVFGRTSWRGQDTESLRALVNRLYAKEAALAAPGREATEILLDIISKSRLNSPSTEIFRTAVCRDLIGNTLCADLLDYLHRDWHHIGKTRAPDLRLLDYLEVRQSVSGRIGAPETSRLVLNLRTTERPRTDAVTSVLDLLESRYQLAEIALFHRTKLNATAMLERAVAEIADARLSEGPSYFSTLVERILDCDDYEILDLLDEEAVEALKTGEIDDERRSRLEAARALLGSIRRRQLHKLALSFYPKDSGQESQMRRFSGDPDPATRSFSIPGGVAEDGGQARLNLARALEEQFAFPPGSFAVYCPRRKMNAKVAQVQVLLDDSVKTLAEHEDGSKDGLTGGHLDAQRLRFQRLWHMHVAVSPEALDTLIERGQESLLERTFDYLLGVYSEQKAVDIAKSLIATMPNLRESDQRVETPVFAGRNQPTLAADRRAFPNDRPLIVEYIR
ncbi:HD domain-containing protein [uncultured Amnibacterium sp.]|uniref:HD domain-containing protein n=1 Tax=uncultured Amnibacterium sp. TaxID=1631851 RepID=UPI0035CBDEC8